MKKILCLILAISMLSVQALPVLADEYDFSDEAQEEFDRQESLKGTVKKKDGVIEIRSNPELEKVKRKDQKTETYTPPQEITQPQQRTESGSVVMIPSGESFEAVLQSSISSESLTNGDIIAATLSTNWYYNGILIAPEGSVLYGRATDIKKAGYAYSNGKLAMSFEEIMTPTGDRIKLSSNKVYIEVKQDKRAAKIAGNVLVGALSGVVTGVLYSLITGGDVVGGLAVGSAVGAAGGAVSAVAHKGEGAEVPAGTVVNVRLVQPVQVIPYGE